MIAFYSTASAILQQFYQQQRNEDTEKEKLRLVEAAVKIIKNDIKSLSTLNETYDVTSLSLLDDAVTLLPDSVKVFLTGVLTGKKKNTSTKLHPWSSINASSSSRGFNFTIIVGLTVQMHYHHGSRFLGETNTEENDESNHSNSQVGETNREENELLNRVSQVYEDLLSGVISIEDACQTECVVTVKERRS